ncbi:tripartite tricarboxylate transporter TctB family protein [bacterium LRH843]|nr:tripartite tricarboxylate transporter TctB family protein [bacterium LRH843]
MTGNLVLSVVSIVFAIFFLIISLQLPPSATPITLGPGAWPTTILILMIFMGVILLLRTQREKRKAPVQDAGGLIAQSEKAEEEFAEEEVYKSKYLVVAAVLFVYLLLLSYVGFILTTPLLLIAIAFVIGIEKWVPIVLSSLIGTACLTYLFAIVLKLPLPRGVAIFKEISLFFY